MTTRIVIGASTWRDYNFLAPLTGFCWRELIGYEPFFLLAGDWSSPEPKRVQVVKSALKAQSFEWVELGIMRGHSEAALAQNSRQHAAALPFTDETWLVPSDADLWPIRREFYQRHEQVGPEIRAVCYYANGDHGQSYPTCHTALRAATWRELYGIAPNGDVVGHTNRSLMDWLGKSPQYLGAKDRNMAYWCSDQWMATEKIRSAPWYPQGVVEIPRLGHPPADRLDRSAWPKDSYVASGYVDAHMPKAPDGDTGWPKVRGLLEKLLPKHVAWAEEYRGRYRAGY